MKVISTLIIAYMSVWVATGASAAPITYINADNGKQFDYATNYAQVKIVPGQKGDLALKYDHVTWSTITQGGQAFATGLGFDVVYNWKQLPPEDCLGPACAQDEQSSKTNGPDTLWIGWTGDDFYVNWSATTAGFLPQLGQAAFNEVRWDGVPETDINWQEQTYHVGLNIKPKPPYGTLEDVPSLVFNAMFLHTYDGDLHLSTSDTIDIAVGYPFSISVGGTVQLQNDHAWYKSLGNLLLGPPAGLKLNDEILLPEPSSLVLVVSGVVAMTAMRMRRGLGRRLTRRFNGLR